MDIAILLGLFMRSTTGVLTSVLVHLAFLGKAIAVAALKNSGVLIMLSCRDHLGIVDRQRRIDHCQPGRRNKLLVRHGVLCQHNSHLFTTYLCRRVQEQITYCNQLNALLGFAWVEW
jgi:hypothetical protein